jgi:hypothetical protein
MSILLPMRLSLGLEPVQVRTGGDESPVVFGATPERGGRGSIKRDYSKPRASGARADPPKRLIELTNNDAKGHKTATRDRVERGARVAAANAEGLATKTRQEGTRLDDERRKDARDGGAVAPGGEVLEHRSGVRVAAGEENARRCDGATVGREKARSRRPVPAARIGALGRAARARDEERLARIAALCGGRIPSELQASRQPAAAEAERAEPPADLVERYARERVEERAARVAELERRVEAAPNEIGMNAEPEAQADGIV